MKRKAFFNPILVLSLILALIAPFISASAALADGGGTWIARANMPTARTHLGVATASNGKVYAIGGWDGLQALATVEEYNPATDTWATRANMPTARLQLAMVAASNGKIYAIGGDDGTTPFATVEEYDPTANTWVTRASMSAARTALAAVATINGKIYAIGGSNNTVYQTTVEVYDPATDTWTTKASMPTARYGLGVAVAANGKIYAIGGTNNGNNNSLATVEEYDPATDTWATRTNMPTARATLGLVAASNGRIYAIGGSGGYSAGFNITIVEEYDPTTDTWATRTDMPTARYALGAAEASNGKIYAIGGSIGESNPSSVVEEFTPPSAADGSWATRASMPTARYCLRATAASNSKIYAIGGRTTGTYPDGLLATVDEYDPATNTWTTRTSMSTVRYCPGVAAANNGKIYAIGGSNADSGNLATVEEYNTVTDNWTMRASMPTARFSLEVAAASNGKLYAIGGYDGSTVFATVEEYDPLTDTWATRANMPTPRRDMGIVAASNGKLYAIGGYDGSNYVTTVEEYDPAMDTWATRASMLTARSDMGVVAASNGKIYTIGGYNGSTVFATVEEYDPLTDTWATRANMPTARNTMGVASASNGRIYVIGGNNGSILATVEEFTPPSSGTSLVATTAASNIYPGDSLTVDLDIQNTNNTYAAQADCAANPAIIQPQSAAFGSFFDPVNRLVGANNANAAAGTWTGAISQRSPALPLSGNGLYATITYTAIGSGTASIDCGVPLFSDRDGQAQDATSTGVNVTVLPFATISGIARYQGRSLHAGITLTATGPVTRTATTNDTGNYTIGQLKGGGYDIQADAPRYLPNCTTTSVTSGQNATLPNTLLKGGDANDDGIINIGDATLVAANFGLHIPPGDARADINGDGIVDVRDLAILGGNYGLSGCQPWQ